MEGFGLAYLEAAAQGVPSIATIGGASEAVVHETSGLVIQPGDQAALDQALDRLLGDDVYRARLGDGARRKAEEHPWLRVAEATYGSVGATRFPTAP